MQKCSSEGGSRYWQEEMQCGLFISPQQLNTQLVQMPTGQCYSVLQKPKQSPQFPSAIPAKTYACFATNRSTLENHRALSALCNKKNAI